MLTRFVRVQLTIFAIASLTGLVVMAVVYMRAPTMLGIGRITVTVELPATGGLYRFSNVTYRGVEIGKVTGVALHGRGAKATLSLDTSPKIPQDLTAQVRSVSAIGEQYLDLLPRSDAPPYLHDGSVIAVADTTLPQQVGPLLDQTSALVTSIPKDKLSALLDESFQAFNGAGYDLASLIDSSAKLSRSVNGVRDENRALVQDAVPLMDAQLAGVNDLRAWARSLAGVTGQLVDADPHVRSLLRNGPATADDASRLLEQLKPTLPVLLANMTSLGQVAVTYRPSLEQVLVLMPPFMANLLSEGPDHNPTGLGQGDFTLTVGDPPTCTVGFLPPSQWRSPDDLTEVDTPEGLYCKLPHDSPLAVRGARNYPCLGKPGKRAPTVEICDSDEPFQPLAMREHMLGPYPLDPNLISQGIPPDARVERDRRLQGPIAGTPPATPAPGSAETPVPPAESAPPPPPPLQPPPDQPRGVPATPSAHSGTGESGPSLAFAHYDPDSGRYVAPDGRTFTQANLAAAARATTWKDLIMAEHT